jgi:L-serine dehydratase
VKAEIGLYGSFAETGQGHGTDRALVAGLLGMPADDLNIPRSFELAKEQGLVFHFYTARLREAHPNTALLNLTDAEGKTLELQAASTGGGRIRVDRLNGVDVCFTGMFNTLIVQMQDKSGEVAEITRQLAGVKINIANMSLYRDRRGGDALMVIEADQKIPPVARALIGELRSVKDMTYYEKEGD